jgi:hypothetical protein
MTLHARRIVSGAILLLLLSPLPSRAGLIVTTTPLGGGVFQYDLTIANTDLINPNTGLPEPIAGLNILKGFSVFGLDSFSTITAPPGWLFFAPDPGLPLMNELNFFSLDPLDDVPIGASLGGFSFESMTDPATLKRSDFAHDFVGGITNQNFRAVPEPSVLTLAIAGLAAARYRSRSLR